MYSLPLGRNSMLIGHCFTSYIHDAGRSLEFRVVGGIVARVREDVSWSRTAEGMHVTTVPVEAV